MPLETLIEGVVRGAGRIVVELVVEVVFNITFRGTGWILLKALRPRSEPEDRTAVWVGGMFWMLVLAAIFVLWWFADTAD